MEGLLTLPDGGVSSLGASTRMAAPNLTEHAAAMLLREAGDDARRHAGANAAYAAAAHLLADQSNDVAATAATLLAGMRRNDPSRPSPTSVTIDDGVASLLYDTALRSVAAGRVGEAIVLLCGLLPSETRRADGFLSLAVCAARLKRFDEALTLATESLKLSPDHPRPRCVAGLCELERGQRKAAQAHLAAAARIARRRPEWREDLRAAQRLLLLMHLS